MPISPGGGSPCTIVKNLSSESRHAGVTQRLIAGVVVPATAWPQRERKHHHPTLARVVALKGHGVVIAGEERSFMALEDGKEAFLPVGIGIVYREVGNDINGNVRHMGSPY